MCEIQISANLSLLSLEASLRNSQSGYGRVLEAPEGRRKCLLLSVIKKKMSISGALSSARVNLIELKS